MPASTPSTFCAFGVPLSMEADVDSSTAGQAGPRAGVPTPSNANGVRPLLSLGATGAQDQDTTITVKTARGGNVGNAAAIWTQQITGPSVEDYRGYDAQNLTVGFVGVTWSENGSQVNPHEIELSDGTTLVAYQQRVGVGDWNIRVRAYDPDTDTYASAVLVVSGLYDSVDPCPYLLLLPDGRILCFYWNTDATTLYTTIDIMLSSDNGATWTTYATQVTDLFGVTGSGATVEYTPRRMVFEIVQGQMIGFYWLTGDAATGSDPADSRETVWQLASGDMGATFVTVGHNYDCILPTVKTVDVTCKLLFGTIENGVAYITARLKTVTPWTLFTTDATSAESPGILCGKNDGSGGGARTASKVGLTMCLIGDLLWMYGISSYSSAIHGQISVNSVSGGTYPYTYWSLVPATWFYDGQATSTEYPQNFTACGLRGQARLHCNFESTAGTYDSKLSRFDIGGYSTRTMPRNGSYTNYWPLYSYAIWTNTYAPTGVPTTYGWTHTGAGTQDITTAPGWLYNATSANTSYDSITPTIGADEGMIVLFRLKVVSGGSVSSTAVGADLRVASVATQHQAALQCSTTQIRVRDVFGAVDLGTVTLDMTAGVDVLIAVNFGKVSAWVRLSAADWDRKWTTIINGGTLTDGGALGTDLLRFGNITAGTGVSEWSMVNYVLGSDLDAGSVLADGFTNPDDLHAFPYAVHPLWLTAGVSITARNGPTFPGDVFTIYPFAEYALSFALPRGDATSRAEIQGGTRPSPQVETRSIDTVDMGATAAWAWNFTAGEIDIPPVLLVHVEGLNTASAYVRTHAPGGISTSRGTLDMTEGAAGLAFLRDGNTIRCDTATPSTDNPFFQPNMLAGGYVDFGGGVVRPIVTNTCGNWTDAGTAEPPTITIDGDDSEPASGTMSVIWPRATFVLYSDGTINADGIDLYWSAPPDTYEGYIKVGAVAVCTGYVLYDVPTWGNVDDQAPTAEVYSSQWGADRPRQIAAARRVIELPFTTTYSDQRLVAANAVVGERIYFRATSSASPPVAASMDTARKLMGVWSEVQGAAVPVVWVSRLVRGTPNSYTLTGLTAGFLGTIRSTPHFSAVGGREAGGAFSQDFTGTAWQIVELR